MSDVTEATTTTAGAGTDPGAATGSSTPPASNAGERSFTQAEVNAMIARDKALWKQQQEQAEARARAQAAEAAAAQAGEWQTVAEQRKAFAESATARADALQAERDALAEAVETTIKGRLKLLPEEIAALAPAGSPADRLAWLTNAEKAAAKLIASTPPRTAGTNAGPRGIGGQQTPLGNNDLVEEKRRRYGGL